MEILTITKENFEAEVLKSDKPVLVDFWAAWCNPCRMLAPVVDAVAARRDDVKFGKINIDEQIELAQQFKVMTIPTLMLFKNGAVATKSVGLITEDEVEDLIEK